MILATLVKELHKYGCTVEETMRFANEASARGYRDDMVGKRIEPVFGSMAYTIHEVRW